jgi:cytochrome b pre-mRNA-processing protein 3
MAPFAMAAGLPRVYGGDKAVTTMALFSRRQRAEREAAERIYAACRAAARRPTLFLTYGVPDTLQGRFEMMALALFPVLNRLMHEPGDDPELAQLVSESFVDDMDAVFREMGVSDPTVPKRMKTLYSSFAGRITAYRNALADDDALIAAIARNVFPDAPADNRAAALAEYLKAATRAVADADIASLRHGDVPFPKIEERSKESAGG